MPKWNPINICWYHLQEAGATPVQELAFAMCTAIAVLDAVRASGQVPDERFGDVVGRMSFFVNAGVRFIEETCKMRAFAQLWDELTRERYGVDDERQRRFRYGVQVNSLGLTEAQPENNVQRIVLEMLGVTLSKSARARAVQLPAWNEALGLPRPWDQQWSLRAQQVLAFESDLLEYDDIFEGSHVIEAKVAEIAAAARDEIDRIQAMGGAVAAIESGYMKQQLVAVTRRSARPNRAWRRHCRWRERLHRDRAESPLDGRHRDPVARPARPRPPRSHRSPSGARSATRPKSTRRSTASGARRKSGDNLMAATLAAARAGATTGEWADALREVFGEYRAPTGVAGVSPAVAGADLARVRDEVRRTGEELGTRLRILVAKPGLDGHSNGAEQIAVRARDCGFEVVYQGIRLTPDEIIAAAVAEDVHLVGISILSGSHLRARPHHRRRPAGGGAGRRAGGRRRHHSARGRRGAQGRRRRRRLHAQGLRTDRDHVRIRHARSARPRDW